MQYCSFASGKWRRERKNEHNKNVTTKTANKEIDIIRSRTRDEHHKLYRISLEKAHLEALERNR
jgi:hypothetical protein